MLNKLIEAVRYAVHSTLDPVVTPHMVAYDTMMKVEEKFLQELDDALTKNIKSRVKYS